MPTPTTGFHPGNPSWRNWVGNQSCVPARIVAAVNEHDVIEAVREARRSGLRLRTPGTGHSFTGIACTDGMLLDSRGMSGVTAIDAKALVATARPSTTIAEFGAPHPDHCRRGCDVHARIGRGVGQLFVGPDSLPAG